MLPESACCALRAQSALLAYRVIVCIGCASRTGDIAGIAVVGNETSTGVRNPVPELTLPPLFPGWI